MCVYIYIYIYIYIYSQRRHWPHYSRSWQLRSFDMHCIHVYTVLRGVNSVAVPETYSTTAAQQAQLEVPHRASNQDGKREE